jgi:hypothetical protein
MTTKPAQPERPARVAGKLSKLWQDESLIRAAMADVRCVTHFKRWPPSAGQAWRKQHGKPERRSALMLGVPCVLAIGLAIFVAR